MCRIAKSDGRINVWYLLTVGKKVCTLGLAEKTRPAKLLDRLDARLVVSEDTGLMF